MIINDNNIGKVAELQENNAGRVSIGGGVGCMFDNLIISPPNMEISNTENETRN